MGKAISVRLPDDLTRKLGQISKVTERTRTYLIRKAVETYLTEYADYQIALDRLHDTDDRGLASTELRKRLGL